MTTSSPVRSCVLGLAAGDAMSWIASDHREQLLPERRITVLRVLDHFADQTRSTTRPRPHVHASPTAVLRPGPGDDLEWFVFTARAQLLARTNGREAILAAWTQLSEQRGELRARVGTLQALDNLAAGLQPPQSGHDNAHYFDDIASVRAVAAGLLGSTSDSEAADLAEADAQVTHSLDGVWCARATAILVSRLNRGEPTHAAVDASVAALPTGTWSRRLADQAVTAATRAASAMDLAMHLDTYLTDKIYSYPVAAPETLALLLAHASRSRTADELMLGAFAHGRNADALPALAGAVAGLQYGTDWIPHRLRAEPVTMDGVCIPSLNGSLLEPTITALEDACTPVGHT